jgi:hypothetical protein
VTQSCIFLELKWKYHEEQRHIGLEPAKENKNKCDYLTKAITLVTMHVCDEELIDFLKRM